MNVSWTVRIEVNYVRIVSKLKSVSIGIDLLLKCVRVVRNLAKLI